jgi:PAB1-binding protein PBP1
LEGSNTTDNIHLKEERGLIDQAEGDEEEKYSSVIRSDNKNSNTIINK